MKFLADGMLGKLTRWLRILGYDVSYSIQLSDNELLEAAKCESRVLLTRDLELYQRAMAKDIGAFFLQGSTEPERLAELAKRYNLPLRANMEKSRCPKCNGKLEILPKKLLLNKVKENTFLSYEQFWRCPKCSKIYWQGAHWKQINNTLEEANTKLRCL
jgi:uncharacterized protein